MKFKDINYIACFDENDANSLLIQLHKKGFTWNSTNVSLLNHNNFKYANNNKIIYKLNHKEKTVKFINKEVEDFITVDEFKDILSKEQRVYTHETFFPSYVKMFNKEVIDRIIFNNNATIVVLKDGSRGVSLCSIEDEYDEFTGFYLAYYRAIKHYLNEDDVYMEVLENIYKFLKGVL